MNPATRNSAKILECYPMIGSTALFMQHISGDVPYAMTNGKQVVFGPGFHKFCEPEKNAVVLHEYLHCVLSHPQRGGIMKIKQGSAFCAKTFNIAADALINYTIKQENANSNHIRLPEGAIDFNEIKKDLENLEIVPVKTLSVSEISVEELYAYLMIARDSECPSSEVGPNQGAENEGDASKARKIAAAKASWDRIQAMLQEDADMLPDEDSYDNLQEKIREQISRNENSARLAGSNAGNLLERIKGDIPKPQIRWESAFRTVTSKYLTRERLRNNRKPSNAMLSHEAMGGARFWEAGRMRTPQPKVLVIADTSGSINMESYRKFLAELSAMKKRTNATLLFGQADTRLGEIQEIKHANEITKLHINGRGGTDFVEPLSKAEKMGVDLIIYMTDLHGKFPQACKIPVIWVSVNNKKDTPPFGRIFRI